MCASKIKGRRRLVVSKKGLRVLGIAESFNPSFFPKKSILVGIVMRGDFLIDGFAFNFVTLKGMDATDKVIEMVMELNRPDISVLMLSGTVISLYNVVDLHKIHEEIKIPIVALSYEESEGIDKYLLEFSDGEKRLEIHRKNGPRIPIILKNGLKIFIRPIGLNLDSAIQVVNRFVLHGRYPEPIRVAKSLARSLLIFFSTHFEEILNSLAQDSDNIMR